MKNIFSYIAEEIIFRIRLFILTCSFRLKKRFSKNSDITFLSLINWTRPYTNRVVSNIEFVNIDLDQNQKQQLIHNLSFYLSLFLKNKTLFEEKTCRSVVIRNEDLIKYVYEPTLSVFPKLRFVVSQSSFYLWFDYAVVNILQTCDTNVTNIALNNPEYKKYKVFYEIVVTKAGPFKGFFT